MSPDNGIVSEPPRYRAFLCYSQCDLVVAAALHRRLESYRTPKQLIGRETLVGAVPADLRPVFRDCDELAASADIGAELQSALRASEFLIVLCSPSAAQSRWVNSEIEFFRSVGPVNRTRIIAVLVAGEPNTGDPQTECLPPILRAETATGDLQTAIPLAADLRTGGRRDRDAELRLVAALLGVPFDDLRRRDYSRRLRSMRQVVAAAALLVAAFAALALVALAERTKATKSAQRAALARNEAENLVDFMVGDLREKLEGVGKLSLLEPANDRIRRYYETVAPGEENARMLQHRAAAIAQQGDDFDARGDVMAAREAYLSAQALRERLVALQPDSVQWQLDLADIHGRLGEIGKKRNNLSEAQAEDEAAAAILRRAVAAYRADEKINRALATSLKNQASIEFLAGRSGQGVEHLQTAVSILAAVGPSAEAELIGTLSDLGQAERKAGNTADAERDLRRAIETAKRLQTVTAESAKVLQAQQVSYAGLSDVLVETAHPEEALVERRRAYELSRKLVTLEPGNLSYQRSLSRSCTTMSELLSQLDRYQEAEPYAQEGLSIAERLVAEHPEHQLCLTDLPNRLTHLGAVYAGIGRKEEAIALALRAVEVRREICARDTSNREMKHWLSYDLYCAGYALADLQRYGEAEDLLEEGIAIEHEVVDADPANLMPLSFLALYQYQFGATLQVEGADARAENAYEAALQTVAMYVGKGGALATVQVPRHGAERGLATVSHRTNEGIAASELRRLPLPPP